MGSKRKLLANGLGEILLRESKKAARFADLFVGSAAVAWYVAERLNAKVVASDLQQYAVALSEGILCRVERADTENVWTQWSLRANSWANETGFLADAQEFEKLDWIISARESVEYARKMCGQWTSLVAMPAYGGYYFSPLQALYIDALRSTLPPQPEDRALALAALLQASAQCAASPGHTAQPFRPTERGAPHLFELWKRDICQRTYAALQSLGLRHAVQLGEAIVCDAITLAKELTESDVAFVDPPYSNVHYSRFYHVLETIARGTRPLISGEGRYPPQSERPRSSYSIRSESKAAIETLLAELAGRGVRTILTFPRNEASNGLSGTMVESMASRYFVVTKNIVNGRFSTLGGNLIHRDARMPAYELILILNPK